MLVTTVVISTATLADNTPVKIATTSNVNKDQNYGHTLTSVNVTDPQISSCFTKAYEVKVQDSTLYYGAAISHQEARFTSFSDGTTATSRDISNRYR